MDAEFDLAAADRLDDITAFQQRGLGLHLLHDAQPRKYLGDMLAAGAYRRIDIDDRTRSEQRATERVGTGDIGVRCPFVDGHADADPRQWPPGALGQLAVPLELSEHLAGDDHHVDGLAGGERLDQRSHGLEIDQHRMAGFALERFQLGLHEGLSSAPRNHADLGCPRVRRHQHDCHRCQEPLRCFHHHLRLQIQHSLAG